MTQAPESGAPVLYGAFGVGPLRLALPVQALREVIAAQDRVPLPCAEPAVVGGIPLRGAILPVLDLRRAMWPDQPGSAANGDVVVVVHDGHLLGLLVDAVLGVFVPVPESWRPVGHGDAASSLLAGSVQRPEDGVPMSVLAAAALRRLPGVPWLVDPQPCRAGWGPPEAAATAADPPPSTPVGPPTTSLLLLRCGRLPVALEALAVVATLVAPPPRASPLARGACVGTVDHGGAPLPVVDLALFLGLGRRAADTPAQLVVVPAGRGRIGLLVEAVVDLVNVPFDDTVPVAAFALPKPSVVRGALSTQALPPDALSRLAWPPATCLVLDSAGLAADAALAALGDVVADQQARAATAAAPAGSAAPTGDRTMLVYALHGPVATPLDQIAEVLPYHGHPTCRPVGVSPLDGAESTWGGPAPTFDMAGPLLGLVVHRGRSIPLLCLRQLVDGRASAPGGDLSVLVVQADDGLAVGYAVPRLHAIEPARWEPSRRPARAAPDDAIAQALAPRPLALVGEGDEARMLPVLDLMRLTQALRGLPLAALVARAEPAQAAAVAVAVAVAVAGPISCAD